MKLRKIALFILAATIGMVGAATGLAYAEDGGATVGLADGGVVDIAAPVAALDPSNPVIVPADPDSYIKAIFSAIDKGDWKMVGILALIFLTFALRKWGAKIPKVGEWLETDMGGALLGFLTGATGYMALAIGAGSTVDSSMLIRAIEGGIMALGLFNFSKKIGKPIKDKILKKNEPATEESA